RRTGRGIFDGGLEISEIVGGDQAVDGEASLLIQSQQCGQEVLGVAAPAQGAHNAFAPQGAQMVYGETRFGGCPTNEDQGAEHADDVGGFFYDRDDAGAIDGEIRWTAEDALDLF